MVKLEEVDDEELNKPQIGPEDDEDWGTDDGIHIPSIHLSQPLYSPFLPFSLPTYQLSPMNLTNHLCP
jgi:hypothetical protein